MSRLMISALAAAALASMGTGHTPAPEPISPKRAGWKKRRAQSPTRDTYRAAAVNEEIAARHIHPRSKRPNPKETSL